MTSAELGMTVTATSLFDGVLVALQLHPKMASPSMAVVRSNVRDAVINSDRGLPSRWLARGPSLQRDHHLFLSFFSEYQGSGDT
jgi:hypothetical protein